MATLIVHKKNPGDLSIAIDDDRILKLFTDVERCSLSIDNINTRIDILWRVLIAGFAGSVGIIGILITLFSG